MDLITTVDLHSNLDELEYDPRAKELYVGCMTDGKTGLAILALPEGKFVGEIRLPAKPQGCIVEQRRTRIFANLSTLHQIAIIDRERRTVLDPCPVPEPQGNTPIALNEAHHRLFVGW